jgi:predicted DNA-binding transcriptional regulator AlpA
MSRKTNTGKLPATGFIRQSQLIPVIIPFSSSTLWRKVKAGTFPAPVKLSERVTAWPVESVRAWMNSLSNQTQEIQP